MTYRTDPVFAPPGGPGLCVENVDGVYMDDPANHSLYNSGNLALPTIPGDFDTNYTGTRQTTPHPGKITE